jgi:hypothetical protein
MGPVMGLYVKIAPGVKVRVTRRGARTSVGPRAARVHFGAGGTGFSTGAGPVSLYKPAHGRRRQPGNAVRSRISGANYQRQLGQPQRSPQASRPGPALRAPTPPPRQPSPGKGSRRTKKTPRAVAGIVIGAFALGLIIGRIVNDGGNARPTGNASAVATATHAHVDTTSRPSTRHTKKRKDRPHRNSATAQVTTPAPQATAPAAAPSPAATPAGCHPLSDEGTCYEPGEYCRYADQGMSGIAGDGKPITCEDNDGLRWEPT